MSTRGGTSARGCAPAAAPAAPFRELRALWVQLTGTLCNLACRHCFNASGPKHPWLRTLDAALVRRYLGEAEHLGVREFYFTGGEPFLHPSLFDLLSDALAVAPTTILTNGTLIDEATADRLAAVSGGSPYSLEICVSLDGVTAAENDAIRGHAVLTAEPDLAVDFVRVPYDHETLAREIEREGMPLEFGETIRTGWWTCCLESSP